MKKLATVFDAQVLSTLEVLKIMLDVEHVDMKTIDGMVSYWRYMSDHLANMDEDYARLFNG